MQRKNDILRVRVEDLNNLGFGVAHVDGKALFIADAVDGDELDARIIHVGKTYSVAKIERLISPSPHRINSFCSAAVRTSFITMLPIMLPPRARQHGGSRKGRSPQAKGRYGIR